MLLNVASTTVVGITGINDEDTFKVESVDGEVRGVALKALRVRAGASCSQTLETFPEIPPAGIRRIGTYAPKYPYLYLIPLPLPVCV